MATLGIGHTGARDSVVVTSTIVQRGNQRVKLRSVAPGEVELGIVAGLQFIVSTTLIFAPPRLLAGNGTAILTLANYPDFSFMAKSVWAVVFFTVGVQCLRAVRYPSAHTRRVAWQFVIPLWACWLTGLFFPLVMGLPTNVIMLSAVTAMVLQWLVTRLLVPPDSYWYCREVPMGRTGESHTHVCSTDVGGGV